MNITVLGAGAWGTALAIHFAKQHHQVRLWARDTEHVLQMKQSRSNVRYLDGFAFPPQLTLETDLQAAMMGKSAWMWGPIFSKVGRKPATGVAITTTPGCL